MAQSMLRGDSPWPNPCIRMRGREMRRQRSHRWCASCVKRMRWWRDGVSAFFLGAASEAWRMSRRLATSSVHVLCVEWMFLHGLSVR